MRTLLFLSEGCPNYSCTQPSVIIVIYQVDLGTCNGAWMSTIVATALANRIVAEVGKNVNLMSFA